MNKLFAQKLKHKITNTLIPGYALKHNLNYFHLKNFSIVNNTRSVNGPYKENNLKGYINYVRKHSFKYANLDPLNISNGERISGFLPEFWGLSELEKIEDFPLDESATYTSEIANNLNTVNDLQNFLQKNYLSNVGVEFEHIDNEEEKLWLYENYEKLMGKSLSNLELQNAFKILYPAMIFEKFLHTKFPTFKRYSGEGANTVLLLLQSLFAECSRKTSATQNVVLTMPHRGRLNILPLIFDYPVANLLSKIQGRRDIPKEIRGIDDVVSHVSVSNEKTFVLDGSISESKPIQVSMLHNPSHLEAANPAGMGKAYAKIQDYDGDQDKVLNVMIHGDSAVSAQGVIYENLSFHKGPGCDIGGSIHIVTNNQIGYTTKDKNSRSSRHCTDIFKSFEIPIVHINADDTESLIKVARLAFAYKQKYKKDIAINYICWRKYGHNEIDEPMFTQPHMYRFVKEKKDSIEIFKEKLLAQNIITQSTVDSLDQRYNKLLAEELEKSKDFELKLEDTLNPKYKGNKTLTHKWSKIKIPETCSPDTKVKTGVDLDELKTVLNASVAYPASFKPHPRLIQYFINARKNSLEKGLVDWPTAEMGAFGTLLREGFNCRISGQDVTRGTFSQRHFGLTDQETNEIYFPYKDKFNVKMSGRLEVNNSSLSEMAVMLFEYGYSLENPKNLAIWEAQFGDFVNGAQIAIDQFISNGESKWMRQSSLTLLLPHGFDGTGPEHSSSRLERFLQLVDSNSICESDASSVEYDHRKINFCIAQPTTPANYFHLLRRQMLREYRKPLVVSTPKIGLRSSYYVSNLSEFSPENTFKPILVNDFSHKDKKQSNSANPTNFIFCTGQIFIEVSKAVENYAKKNSRQPNLVLIRLEELAPFPEKLINEALSGRKINESSKAVWIQEESMNVGAFTYVQPQLNRVMRKFNDKVRINYIGREAQSGANGCLEEHKKELVLILKQLAEYVESC